MIDATTETAKDLQEKLKRKEKELEIVKKTLNESNKKCAASRKNVTKYRPFSVEYILQQNKTVTLFKYYTGMLYVRFVELLHFLLGDLAKLKYKYHRKDIDSMLNRDCLLLVLCRLRHNFCVTDLATRFSLSVQSVSEIFETWICHMFYKFGQISLMPSRDVVIRNMPVAFKKDFPNTLILIDATELKTQVPCSLSVHSSCYSDYKSSTTLKALIACDPNGALCFCSQLFTGSISDKALTEQGGFYKMLKIMKNANLILDGDGIMADKGFTIHNEINELGLILHIPPFISSTSQLSPSESLLTKKIAKHRVHVERLISRVKVNRILSDKIPTVLFKRINEIWCVCCFLTLFQDGYLKNM